MKLGSKKHKLSKRLLQINPTLTVKQMAYRLRLYDDYQAIKAAA